MKKAVQIIFLTFALQFSLSAQIDAPQTNSNNTANHIIEGGRLVVDIIKIFKKDKQSETSKNGCKNGISELCFQNKSSQKVQIKIEFKGGNENGEDTELLIPTKGKECSFTLGSGIYKYGILLSNEKNEFELIRQGEIVIEECQEYLIKVENP